jgi:PAS domain S-box-containing protein
VTGPVGMQPMNKAINVLLLEDRESDAEMMIRELQRAGFLPKWKRVQTEPDFVAEIKNLPDIILSDYSMPQFSGLRAAELLQKAGLHIPFILISGTVGEDVAVEAMQHGATDYLLKDRLGRLGIAVERALEQTRLRNERDQAEEALFKAGALQRAIFNSVNFSSIATDANGVIQIFNVGAERMLGYTAAEVVNIITAVDIHDSLELIERAAALSREFGTPIAPGFEALVFKAARGIEDIYELTKVRKDGSRFPAVLSVTALRDAQEEIIGYLLIGTDNTARHKAEEERTTLDQRLRDQQFYTRSLLESNIDALMATDPRGIIIDVNKQTETLTGSTRDELIGAPFKNYFTDPAQAEAGIQRVLNEGKVTNYELTARARDGNETVVSYNATTFYDRDRRLQGVFAAARDITDRKRVEVQLKLYSDKLERSNRELQDFAQVASHDLQEPLRKIVSFGDRLKAKAGDSLNEECGDSLQRMTSAAARMQILIGDLMEFSRVETKGHPFVDADLGLIAREVSADLEARVEQAGGRIDIEALPTIEADPMQMRQLLQNLIGNSLKYFRPGVPPVVRIYSQNLAGAREWSMGDGAQPQRFCELSVTDNGIGFDEKYLDRIFTVFQRLHNKTEYEGTGIGLAICRKIVDRHSGTITARSSPGKGATFVVRLPVIQAKEVEVL